MPSVHIENIGPIPDATFDINPGVTVIKGAPGSGKSTALRTIQLAVDGRCDMKPTKRDGANRGLIEVDGKVIRITKTTRVEGEMSYEGLGDLSIADLHTPKFCEADKRDEHRIKTLVALSGVKADPEMFYHLLGGRADFRDIVSSKQLETTDLVEMAARIKSEIESEARRVEKQAGNARSDAKAHLAACEGVDLEQPISEKELNDAWQRASGRHGTLKERREAWLKAQQAAAKAREKLAELPPGLSVTEAEAKLQTAIDSWTEQTVVVKKLEDRLAELKHEIEMERSELSIRDKEGKAARVALESAKRDVSLRGELDAAIEAAAGAVETTEDDVDDAAIEVGNCRRAVAQAMETRKAIEQKRLADEENEKAKRLEKRADELRAAAAGTFDVLTEAIAKIEDCPLRVKTDDNGAPRLVTETERSESTYFDELSGGQKWDLVMRIATRRNRLIAFPQEAFGELAPSLRDKLHEAAKAHGAFVVTALATDGELCAVPYEPSTVKASAAE